MNLGILETVSKYIKKVTLALAYGVGDAICQSNDGVKFNSNELEMLNLNVK